jgi:hypothetical protein
VKQKEQIQLTTLCINSHITRVGTKKVQFFQNLDNNDKNNPADHLLHQSIDNSQMLIIDTRRLKIAYLPPPSAAMTSGGA